MISSGSLVLLLVLAATVLAAPTCGPPDPVLATLNMCAPYAPVSAYYDTNVTAPFINSAYSALRQFGILGFGHTGASRACFDMVARVVCSMYVPPCQMLSTGSGSSVPAFSNPCGQSCTDLAAFEGGNCLSSFLAALGPSGANLTQAGINAMVPACNLTFPASAQYVAGQPVYGPITWNVGIQPNPVVQCSNLAPTNQTSTSFPCTWAIRPATQSTPYGYCEIICPYLLNQDITKMATMLEVLTFIQLFVCLAVLILRFTVRKFSVYPTNLVQVLLAGWCLQSLLLSWQAVPGVTNVICINGQLRATSSNSSICAAQSVFVAWGVLLYTFAWAIVALHAAVVVILKRDPWNRITMFVTYGFLLVVPLVLAAAGMLAGGSQGQTTLAFCHSTSDPNSYGTFFAPIGLCLIIGTTSIIIVVVQMLRASAGSSFGLVQNLRLLIFLILMLYSIGFLFGYRFWFTANNDALNAQFGNIYACSLFARQTSDCVMSQIINIPALWAEHAEFGLIGTLTAVLFACQKELWTNWEDRIPPWIGIMQGKGDGASTSTTAGSSSSSSSSASGGDTFMSDLQ